MKRFDVAFVGFRHGHIFSLYDRMAQDPRFAIRAVCEENEAESLLAAHPEIAVTDTDFDAMLARVKCDIVAIGDYYAKRGSLAIRALRAGRHVISDKPLCTSLAELDEIEELSSVRGLEVGCMFELRSAPAFATAREMIRGGKLGKITQIQFTAQHPLMRASRPAWYFEPGKHGGTISDIAVHGIDIIPYLTGLEIGETVAARTWQAFDSGCDCFNDAAQFMLKLDNGCGVLGDVSYSAPDSCGYTHPAYWRFTIWGTKGMIEFNCGADSHVNAWLAGQSEVVRIAPSAAPAEDYLAGFLHALAGEPAELDTKRVLRAMRRTLEIQQVADRSAH